MESPNMEQSFGWDLASLDFDFANHSPVRCMLCEREFCLSYDFQHFLTHLLDDHKFIIGKPEEVPDFRQYVLYWNKLRHEKLSDYCIVYLTNTEPGAKEIKDTFYLLSDKLPEDKILRTTIRQLKLKYLASEKEREYRDKEFSRQCIYCNLTIGGGVSNSFKHLKFDHGFSVGNPDNIVFGGKLLDIMEDKLNQLICLCCERTFKNHLALREHMRKKQHRTLNPSNKMYDRFYMLNYLKPGTPWEEAKREFSLDMEGPQRENEGLEQDEVQQDEELWLDWREESAVPTMCLFCPYMTNKVPEGLFCHMNMHHDFNFETITCHFNFYQKVKLINYIRSKVQHSHCIMCDHPCVTHEDLLAHMSLRSHFQVPEVFVWDQVQYMIPVIENDGLLFHLEDNDVEDDTSSTVSSINEEIILPEDLEVSTCSSILKDWTIRDAISSEKTTKHPSNKGDDAKEDCVYRCLFCSHTANGEKPRQNCVLHMNLMHNFNVNDVARGLDQDQMIKLINYIRAMTKSGKCFFCCKGFLSKAGLEEHRILEGHSGMPPPQLFNSDRWSPPVLPQDGFLQYFVS